MGKVKYNLENFECDNCSEGVVQVRQEWKRGGTVTTTVTGCLDCKKEFGIKQAMQLTPNKRPLVWP